jgi:hypothetical protein
MIGETRYFLPTSNKGGNTVTFSILCCFSPLWLPTAPLTPCKIVPEMDSKSAWNCPQNQPKICPKIGFKLSPKSAPKLAPKLALNHPKSCRNTYLRVKSLIHGCMARGGYGFPKVSPRPAMPYQSTPGGQATTETPYGCFRGGPPAGRWAYYQLLPLWTPHAIRVWFDPKVWGIYNLTCN